MRYRIQDGGEGRNESSCSTIAAGEKLNVEEGQ